MGQSLSCISFSHCFRSEASLCRERQYLGWHLPSPSRPDLGACSPGLPGLGFTVWRGAFQVHMCVCGQSQAPEGQACQASSVLPSSFPSRAWAQLGRPAPSDIPLPLLEDALWGPQSESLLDSDLS